MKSRLITSSLTAIVALVIACNAVEEKKSNKDKFPPKVELSTLIGHDFNVTMKIEVNETHQPKSPIAHVAIIEDHKERYETGFSPNSDSVYKIINVTVKEGRHEYYAEAKDIAGNLGRSRLVTLSTDNDGKTIEYILEDNNAQNCTNSSIKITKFEVTRQSPNSPNYNIEYAVQSNCLIDVVNFYFIDKKKPSRTSKDLEGIFTIRHSKGAVNYKLEAVDINGKADVKTKIVNVPRSN